jgi:hypothetical protein
MATWNFGKKGVVTPYMIALVLAIAAVSIVI